MLDHISCLEELFFNNVLVSHRVLPKQRIVEKREAVGENLGHKRVQEELDMEVSDHLYGKEVSYRRNCIDWKEYKLHEKLTI